MKAFFESSANRTGLAIWLSTVIVAAMQYFVLHQVPASADLLGLVLGLVKIIQPDNTVTAAQLTKAIADVQCAITTKSPAAIETAIEDGMTIAKDVIQPAAPAAKTGV